MTTRGVKLQKILILYFGKICFFVMWHHKESYYKPDSTVEFPDAYLVFGGEIKKLPTGSTVISVQLLAKLEIACW